jgi:hypothetical protein
MSKRNWYVERAVSLHGKSYGDWMVRCVGPDGRGGSSCWFGSRAEAVTELRRWMSSVQRYQNRKARRAA